MYQLEFADGSFVTVSMAGVGQNTGLWIHAHNLTLIECVNIFGNPQKTSTMHIQYDETISDNFVGFTNLVSVSTCDDFVKIGLEKV